MSTKKVYVLELQMGDAQRQLTEAIAKLEQLQTELNAVGSDTEAGKALAQQLAAAAKQVQGLTAEVEGLDEALVQFKPGSIGALEREVEELELAWKRTTKGTKESQEALLALGRARGELRELEDAVDALHPKEQAAAFVDFTNGLVGGFSIASVAATQWGGLSSESAEKVDAAMQQLLVVMSGFEAISRATNSETLANVKNTYALAKAYLFGAESASTASKITRAALVATGIGAVILLVGVLIANWDSFKTKFGGTEKLFTKVREVASGVFSGLLASLKNVGEVVTKLWDGDFSGAVAKAKHIGQDIAKGYAAGVQEVVEDEHRKFLQQQIEHQEQLLKVQQAGGFDTAKLQRKILVDKLAVLKNGTEEEKKAHEAAAADLAAFDAQQAQKRRQDALAVTLARLNGVVALEQAKGKESYRAQLQAKEGDLAGLLAAETKNQAAIDAKQREIAAFKAQHDTEQAGKRRARYIQSQQEELSLLEKQGRDTLALRVAQAEELLAYDTDVLRRQEQAHEQAGEQQIEQAHASSQALLLVQAEYEERVRAGLAENQAQRQELAEQGRETDKKFIEGTADYLADAANKSLQKKSFDLGATLLTTVFGVKPEQVEGVRAAFNQAFTEVAQDVNALTSTMLTAGLQAADAAIQAAQDRLQELDSQLSEVSSKRQADEAALASASGAKREYLTGKIERERKAEAALAAQKAQAAREEASAQKEKAKLEKEQQQLAAASTAIEAVLLAIQAAQTVVKIASKGFTGYDNIALAIAGAATIATSMFAVKNAARQFESGTGALGSDGVLRGPRHAQGGIDIYGADGSYYGEAEGGEAITPVDATRHNGHWLELIRTKGRTRALTPEDFKAQARDAWESVQLAPLPAGYHQGGGILSRVGSLAGGLASGVELSAQLERHSTYLAQIASSNATAADAALVTAKHSATTAEHTAATAQSNSLLVGYGPPRLAIGHHESLQIEETRQEALDAMALVVLGASKDNTLRKLGWHGSR